MASTAASVGPVLPIPGAVPRDEPLVRCRITPEPCAACAAPQHVR